MRNHAIPFNLAGQLVSTEFLQGIIAKLLVVVIVAFVAPLDDCVAQTPLSSPTSKFSNRSFAENQLPNQFIGRQNSNLFPNEAVRPASFQTQSDELPAPQEADLQVPIASQIPQMPSAKAVRIKDITTIEGHRTHQLRGRGLVTGLGGTGGKGPTTRHFAKNYFLNSETQPQDVSTKNLSVVEIFLEVPPFCKPGEKLIATVSVIDDASSLAGGVLSNTALKGIDGAEYATAFGPLDIDGIAVSGSAGSVGKNFPTVGKVQAQLEVEICNGPVFKGNSLRLLLHNKDESTAFRIATEINRYFPRCAEAHHSGFVDVQIPQGFVESPNAFVYMINQLRVEPDNTARVVFNRKTGTIVIGENVRLSSVMFAKDNLVVSTSETPIVSQPAPFSQGQTVALPRTQIQVSQEGSRYNVMQENMNVIDLAKALNALGVSPQDIMSIFDGIKKEGSLHAELVID